MEVFLLRSNAGERLPCERGSVKRGCTKSGGKTFFVNFSQSANYNIMFGEKALELIKQLKRARDGTLPPFDVRNLCYNVC